MKSLVMRWATSVLIATATLSTPSFVAAKSLLETRSQSKQCKILEPWVGEMTEAAGTRVVNDGSAGQEYLDVGEFIAHVAPMFTDEKFKPVFGKSFLLLTAGDKIVAQRAIGRCFSVMGNYSHLHEAFRKYTHPNWIEAVREASSDPRSVEEQIRVTRLQYEGQKTESERRFAESGINKKRRDEAAKRPRVINPHGAGGLLLESDILDIHEYRYDTHDVGTFCSTSSFGREKYAIIIKENGLNLSPPVIESIIQKIVVPLHRKTCPGSKALEARFYFDGVFLGGASGFLTEQDVANGVVDHFFAHVDYGPISNKDSLNISYISNLDKNGETSLSGLAALAGRNFMSPEDYARNLAKDDAFVRAVGFIPKEREVRLVVKGGVDMANYFQKRRATLLSAGAAVHVLHAWSAVMRGECKAATPGGMSMARYTETNERGYVRVNQNVSVPSDFYPHYEYLIKVGLMGNSYEMQRLLPEFRTIVEKNGCSSSAVRNVHRNIRSIADTVYAPAR